MLLSHSFFQLSLIIPGLLATGNHILSSRKAITVQNLPGNWSSVGCFTDVSTSRTLQGQFTSNDIQMTVESCITTCNDAEFIFAGVEFGQECYCDSTIQNSGNLTSLDECDIPCTGNSSETCGGSGRLQIFTNGKPGPSLLKSVNINQGSKGTWDYEGCFADSPSTRVLETPVDIQEGVTVESCIGACLEAGFTTAGVEDSRECWCGSFPSTSTTVNGTRASDDDCRGVCVIDHSEYCGNANRIAVYSLANNTGTTTPQNPQCDNKDVANFTLVAKYNNNSQNAGAEVPLKIVQVEIVPSVTWGILSACPLCCSDYPSFSLENSTFLPHSLSNPNQLMFSVSPLSIGGESPAFMAPTNPAGATNLKTGQSYCALDGHPPLLSLEGKSDAFALCRNSSSLAAGRLDVVFEPIAGHPHYALADCESITIQIQAAA